MTLLTDLAAWFDDVKAEFILNFIDKNRWRMLLTGLGNTLLIALLACLIGIVLGVVVAILRTTWDNAGTGMRASVMLHLAGLAMLARTGQVIRAVSQLGLTVRGLYGEGSEASGDLYQLSNQITLGRTEEEILKLLSDTAEQVIGNERAAREMLLQQGRTELEDKLMRSYGIFTQARLMTTKEFMTRLSNVRLAADLGFVSVAPETLDRLQRDVQPATLERNAGRKLSQGERDELRAEIIRKALT